MEIPLIESLLEGFKIGLAIIGAVFTWENLKDISPFLIFVLVMGFIGLLLGTAIEMVKSFFSSGLGQLVLLMGFGVVAANVWIF